MLRIFDRKGNEITDRADAACGEPGWFDLLDPTPEEITRVEAATGTELPSRDELEDIEPSSRLYIENNAIYMTASLAYRAESHIPGLTDTGFILTGDKLVTIRHAEPKAFRIFTHHMLRSPEFNGGTDILLHLLEAIVERAAEVLEGASRDVDNMTTSVFHAEDEKRPDRATRNLEGRLIEISTLQRLVAKVRESLITLARVAAFLQSQRDFIATKPHKDKCRSISRDIASLAEHASFIASNINFVLDACLGLISVQQNNVMKIFSIAAVLLLPPTFIGAVYGMNFDHMPELHWRWGYPAALIAMVLSGVVPFLWFRKKGWL